MKGLPSTPAANSEPKAYWSLDLDVLFSKLKSSEQGLTEHEAAARLKKFGPNTLKVKRGRGNLFLFFSQFKSPLILILLFAAALAALLHERVNPLIILSIVFISGFLSFWQEKGAAQTMKKLLAMVQVKALVLRRGVKKEIPLDPIVPGDILLLAAGDIIPADGVLIESKDFFVDEAALTGESYGVEKKQEILEAQTPFGKRTNMVYMGSHVISGMARVLVVETGKNTEFGKIAQHYQLRVPETEFEHGIRHFGYFLMEVTLLLILFIFIFNFSWKHSLLESLLFSLALAVGLTPQLLPAIISVNLAHGAKRMQEKKRVIVKKLDSIENFGSMNILCADKTGTLTEGRIQLRNAIDWQGKESESVSLFGYLNAYFQTGYSNPIDRALVEQGSFDLSFFQKLDEIPYDFVRKRISILVEEKKHRKMISKGALNSILPICSYVENPDGTTEKISTHFDKINSLFENLSTEGYRILAVAYRPMEGEMAISREQEQDMIFVGFLVFFDPPKKGIEETIEELQRMGIALKVITGDNRFIAAHVAKQVGITNPQILIGGDLAITSDRALSQLVHEKNVFAEVEPNQKEKIILALRKRGNVVGYMGDGINDSSALHAADVSISVDSAVDVVKEAADVVIFDKSLAVLSQGVMEGRKTFGNTLKYIFMATSANFGNMFSVAGASLLLPFLPLLPTQILLTNFLTDIPEMAISTDNLDEELLKAPLRLHIPFIAKFMVVFGLLSSIFDFLTFGALYFFFHSSIEQWRTGWFLESVLSASIIVLVIRSRKPFFSTKPSKILATAIFLSCLATLFLPYTPLASLFQFVPLSVSYFFMIGGILVFYLFSAEIAKKIFYKKVLLK